MQGDCHAAGAEFAEVTHKERQAMSSPNGEREIASTVHSRCSDDACDSPIERSRFMVPATLRWFLSAE
jgi:hypothetical protein